MSSPSIRRFRLRDAFLAAALVGACLITTFPQARPLVVDLAMVACALAAPFTRWRWPLPTVIAITAALAAAAFCTSLPAGTVALAPFAAYIIRRHLPAACRNAVSAAFLVGDVVATSFIIPALVQLEPVSRLPALVWSVTIIVAASLFGELRRRAEETAEKELQAQLERQREEFERTAGEQRAHLAREIHDIVTHSLTVIVAQADGAMYAAGPNTKDEALRTIASVGRESLHQMRGVVGLLRGPESRPTTPLADLDIAQLVATSRAGGLDVNYATTGQPPAGLAPAAALTLHRIAQESLTNAFKHGTGTAQLTVDWQEDTATLRVSNPLPPHTPPVQQGHGLRGMQERASLVDGSVTAAPTNNHTWVTEATIPLKATQ